MRTSHGRGHRSYINRYFFKGKYSSIEILSRVGKRANRILKAILMQ
jgi:hypothetical protein